MTTMLRISALMLLCCCAGQVDAQTRGAPEDIAPRSMGNDMGPATRSRAAPQSQADFARCIVGADAAGSKALLALKPGSGESRKAVEALAANATCSAALGGKKPGEGTLRGAIAERLYLDTFATPPAELTGPPPAFTGSDDPNLAKYDMARCGATRDPVGADMLIRAGAGTPEEAAAIQRVVAAVGRCTLHAAFGKAELHALIAEGMWKIRSEGSAQ